MEPNARSPRTEDACLDPSGAAFGAGMVSGGVVGDVRGMEDEAERVATPTTIIAPAGSPKGTSGGAGWSGCVISVMVDFLSPLTTDHGTTRYKRWPVDLSLTPFAAKS